MPPDPRTRSRITTQPEPLDAINRQVIVELQGDPRLSMSELARRVGLSPPAVTERVDRLRQAGVIAGWRLEIDPASVGLPLTAFARMQPGPGQLARTAALLPHIEEVTECHRITGEDCFLLKLHVASMGHLADVLDRVAVHGRLTTSIVVSTPVPLRAVTLPRADGAVDRRR